MHTSTTAQSPCPIRRGVTFGFYARRGYFETERARQEVDRMVELHVDTVCLVPTVMQETGQDPRQFADFEITPSDFELMDIIEYIHSKGMKVELRPMIETFDGHGRLQIWFPPDQAHRIAGLKSNRYARWFAGMRARTRHYARLAKRMGCAVYGLDSEIDLFTKMSGPWREVVEVARSEFDGPVTSCHTFTVPFVRQLQQEDHWFRDLDYLEISNWRKSANEPGVSLEERIAFIQQWLVECREIAALLGKPVAFGEFGCTSCVGGGTAPWDWQVGDTYDGGEQADHFEAFIRVFWDEPWFAGLNWWKWEEQNDRPQFHDDPAGDKGFTVWGKPAADVMKRWYGREDRRLACGADA